MNKSSTGLEQNIASVLTYVVGWVTGLVFFFIEKENKTVKFHAVQSILVFGPLSILSWIISLIRGAMYDPLKFWTGQGPLYGFMGLLGTIIWIGTSVLWVFLMYKAYNNEEFKIPVLGDIAEKQADKSLSL